MSARKKKTKRCRAHWLGVTTGWLYRCEKERGHDGRMHRFQGAATTGAVMYVQRSDEEKSEASE
ncbi:MAG: hypothetical protein JWM74_5704 [Myxococcaceae bacterium]|nr:hypothetical protein [Myxococcaceae bacterium]